MLILANRKTTSIITFNLLTIIVNIVSPNLADATSYLLFNPSKNKQIRKMKKILYSESEVKEIVKNVVRATMEGMMKWYESDHTWIQDKTTKERIDNCELEADRDVSPLAMFINPLLEEKAGIKYEL